ncbi:MAG: penicillin-binding protein activator LpoB [Planctomycetes bacterium]|nr:penicillin-binding protein activator LpoB [Planctomycetota bacterium]
MFLKTTIPAPKTLALLGALAALTATTTGCAGKTMRRLDPSKDDNLGGTLIDSADVMATSDMAAAEISKQLLASPRSDIVVAFSPVKNESVQPINTALLSDRIRDRVFAATAPRVKFLAREQLDEIMKEREGKRTGVFSGAGSKQLLGATHLLTGRIKSLSKKSEGDRADYFQLSFQLVDAEDSQIVWSNSWEFKKQGDSGVIYQ